MIGDRLSTQLAAASLRCLEMTGRTSPSSFICAGMHSGGTTNCLPVNSLKRILKFLFWSAMEDMPTPTIIQGSRVSLFAFRTNGFCADFDVVQIWYSGNS